MKDNKIFKDTKEVFEHAIKCGVLSEDEINESYAGNYMYMYSEDGADYFKHIGTRDYVINEKGL